ncbi:MAG: DUF4157 domain-containing protein [Myxococcales bacterium]|nr:DUF4157 domain-containing protein [Myxococcales bacterium]
MEAALPATAPAMAAPAVAEASPAVYAAQLRANPASMQQTLAQLHQTHGNTFVQQVLAELGQSPAAGGKPLPPETRAKMESAFGADLSAVRVHEDGAADAAGAQAYANGTNLHFAAGRFDPGSKAGQELIGHEVAHVVQQSEGRASATQNKGGAAATADAGLEREADEAGARAARGQKAGIGTGATLAAPAPQAPIVQQKTTVTEVPATLKTKDEVLGDGTPANPGLALPALKAYTTKQADWFTEPSFTAPDREAVWKVVSAIHAAPHMVRALANLHTGEVAALPSREVLGYYADGFNPGSNWTVPLSTPAPTLARALELGQAQKDLAEFVPGPVLRHVIPESGLAYLMKGKLADFKYYMQTFRPSLEKPEEWEHIETLLQEGVRTHASLLPWISELHIFSPATRARLKVNITDKSKSRPVLLVLMSAVDWNTAFLQGANMEQSVTDPHNLGLIVQGRTLAAVTGQVTRVATEYGKGGKIGQVVIAGHGSDTSMEMASDHGPGDAWWDPTNNRVGYDKAGDVDSKNDPKKNGTEKLIDTILESLDPATANLVFAGCLINSHNIDPAKSKLTGSAADIERRLRANIKAHPNLADYVKSRMDATGHKATMSAANASTVFSTYSLDATGKAQLNDPTDPDIGGTKLGYVRTGIEPEGVLRACIECCADPAIGIKGTTAEMEKRVAALASSTDGWETCVRVAMEVALHRGPGKDVDVALLADLVQRVKYWLEAGSETNAAQLADNVKKGEAGKLFPALLAVGYGDDTNALYRQAWMKFDPGQATHFMSALGTSGMTVEQFKLQLSRKIVDPHLTTLLPISATPTQAQMLLALAIANEGSLPPHVKNFLVTAAGGPTSRAFPAGLNVSTLFPNGEPHILERIGLSDTAAPPPGTAVDGNADLDQDGKNEARIDVNPHKATVTADVLNVRERAGVESKIIGSLKKGTVVRVSGTVRHGYWSMIDFDGKAAFVSSNYLE